MHFPNSIRAAAALAVAIASFPASAEQPVFRYKSSLSGSNPGVPSDPPPPPPGDETEPAAGPTTHLRLTVQSFSGASGASVAEVAFTDGAQRLVPISHEIVENAGTNSAAAFDGNTGTAWSSSSRAVTRFVYEIAKGQEPDHLELVASSASAPAAFLVERSSDGISYVPVVSYSGESGWAAGEKRRYPFAKPGTEVGAGARRYWRVLVDRWNPAIYKSIHTVAFKDAGGQTISGAGGPYRIEPGYAGLTSALFDGDASTVWQADYNDVSPAGIVYDFGSPRDVASVDIGVNAATGVPQRLWIESSEDGKRWEPRARHIGQGGWSAGETRNFAVGFPKPADGHHQFWRLAVLKTNRADGAGSLTDLDVVDASGASMLGKAIVAGSSESSVVYGTAYITPGDYNNPWIGKAGEALPWAGYTFPAPVKPAALVVRARDANSPRDMAVQWSDDEVNWTTSSIHRGHGSWKYEQSRSLAVEGLPAANPGEHRFWRVAVERPWSMMETASGIGELDWRDFSGASIVGEGTPFAAAGDAVAAFDGQKGRYFARWTAAGGSGWVGYEFTRPVAPATFVVHGFGLTGPRDLSAEWSDDGASWTRASRHVNNGLWGEYGEDRTFAAVAPERVLAPGEHRFWRVTVRAVNGGTTLKIGELDFLASDGIDRQVGGTPLSSIRHEESHYLGVAQAFTNTNSEYEPPNFSTAPLPISVGYAFKDPVKVTELRMTGPWVPENAPRSFLVEWSDDGSAWTVAADVGEAANWGRSETRSFAVPSP